MNYINIKVNGKVETIDEFEDRKEARKMLYEYHFSYGDFCTIYLSQRCTNVWREKGGKNE